MSDGDGNQGGPKVGALPLTQEQAAAMLDGAKKAAEEHLRRHRREFLNNGARLMWERTYGTLLESIDELTEAGVDGEDTEAPTPEAICAGIGRFADAAVHEWRLRFDEEYTGSEVEPGTAPEVDG